MSRNLHRVLTFPEAGPGAETDPVKRAGGRGNELNGGAAAHDPPARGGNRRLGELGEILLTGTAGHNEGSGSSP